MENNKNILDENPNKPLTEQEIKTRKTKRIIAICVMTLLLAVAITLTVLCFTVFKK